MTYDGKIRILNTLSGEKEELQITKKRVNFFVCGPTVYDHAHMGHARTYLTFDSFARYLRARGIKLFYLQNITDVDDKIIIRAKKENRSPLEVAKEFTNNYLSDMKNLDITSVNRYSPASKFIPHIVKQVLTLIQKGYAYRIEGSGYYFDISKFTDYGKLSKRTVAQAEDGVSRIDEEIKKKNKGDFALWKFVDVSPLKPKKSDRFHIIDSEPAWNTLLGWGRPGWHIEDTAITEHFFGPQYDIHGGGDDLKFPHHEAEIAQQEAASGMKPFVRIWMHIGFVRIEGKKMSKSLGNFTTIRDILKTHNPLVLRWLMLLHHYRTPINYTPELLDDVIASLENIRAFLDRLTFIEKNSASKISKDSVKDLAHASEIAFHSALDDDFNTPLAIGKLFTYINTIEKDLFSYSKSEARTIRSITTGLLHTLGITLKVQKIPLTIKSQVKKRELYRTNKQFIQADTLRKNIESIGYIVEDTPLGPLVRCAPHSVWQVTK